MSILGEVLNSVKKFILPKVDQFIDFYIEF